MSKFSEDVLTIVKQIPSGKVVSYGQVALLAGHPRAARQVGCILHFHGEEVPWWRVINNAGRISTKCIEHNADLQREFLREEEVEVGEDLSVDIAFYRWYFPETGS